MEGSQKLLAARVRGEFREMPGLCLTIEQASRLWQVDRLVCEIVLRELVRTGVLQMTSGGAYVAASLIRERG